MCRRRLLLSAAAVLLSAVAVGACGGGAKTSSPAAGGSSDKVEVSSFAFKPGKTTVKAGTTVVWTFKDTAAHTVASKAGESEIPQSPEMTTGEYSHQFTKAGTFAYVCTIHNSMTGTVVVTA